MASKRKKRVVARREDVLARLDRKLDRLLHEVRQLGLDRPAREGEPGEVNEATNRVA